jgi:cytochrome bd-type quinol oxidase subunit 1
MTRTTQLMLTVLLRLRALRDSRERGSETTEKVMWISAVIGAVVILYPILTGKLSAWFNALDFNGF